MSEWDVKTATSDNRELYNNYVKNHPECRMMKSEAIWSQMKKDGVINEQQYQAAILGLSSSVFNPKSSIIDSPMVSFSHSKTKVTPQNKIPYAPIKYHKDSKDIIVNSQGKIDRNQYTLEGLKKRFSPKDYDFKTTKEHNLGETGYTLTTTYVIAKKTQKLVLEIRTTSDNNEISITKNNKKDCTEYKINKDGYLTQKNEFVDIFNYKYTEYQENGSMLPKYHWEQKDDELVLDISYYDNGQIKTYEQNDKVKYKSKYDINGKILEKTEYRDGGRVEIKYQNGKPIKTEYFDGAKEKHDLDKAKDIATSIRKNLYHLGTCSEKDMKKYLKEISAENIEIIENEFKSQTGENLSDTLIKMDTNAKPFFKNAQQTALINHVQKCWEQRYGFNPKYQDNNNQVKNDWHTGDPYSIKQDGNKLIAVNKKTGKRSTINLDLYLKDFTVKDKAQIKSNLQKLPGEVLDDLVAETTNLYGKNTSFEKHFYNPIEKIGNLIGISDFKSAGYFNPVFDSIVIKTLDHNGKEVIVHELGHAIDFKIISFESDSNNKFEETFNKEMDSYKAKGNKEFSYLKNNGSAYCTANKNEMFAECYTLLMTGENNSKDCILEHFPETLKLVEQMLIEARKNETRHR